jgi:hypothetical protein
MTRTKAAFARMREPHGKGYWDKTTADWVRENYSTWTIAEWEGLYGRQGSIKNIDAKHVIDSEGRHWEFFGFLIPLYDDDKKT